MRDADRVRRDAPLAPRWHTALLLALYVSVAITGAALGRRGGNSSLASAGASRISGVYLPLIFVQLGLAAYVAWSGRPAGALSALVGHRWTTLKRALEDVALAACAWVLILGVEVAWASVVSGGIPHAVSAMLPHSVPERLVWIVVSVVVACCEELVFRGYFLSQFLAFTGRAGTAIALQACVFGIAHAEQGPGAIVRITLHGALLGVLAWRRRSLLPGIVCHAWTDVASGMFLR